MATVPPTQSNPDPGLVELISTGWMKVINFIGDAFGRLDSMVASAFSALATRVVFCLFTVWVIWRSFTVGDAIGFQRPDLARIFFWHFPCPMLASTLLLIGAGYCLRYMRTGSSTDDIKAQATLRLGFVFCLLTMATGIVFSKSEWGAWWQWDPRQTSFLMVILIYGAYFALRSAYQEPERKAAYGAAYILAATLPAMFLIFVFPRLPQIAPDSLHPTNSILGGQIKGGYAQVIWLTLCVTTILTVWLYRIQVRLLETELLINKNELEISSLRTTHSVVARPIRVSPQPGSQSEPPSICD